FFKGSKPTDYGGLIQQVLSEGWTLLAGGPESHTTDALATVQTRGSESAAGNFAARGRRPNGVGAGSSLQDSASQPPGEQPRDHTATPRLDF
ncbi:Hypothetical predicted protein, partial [Marmota monax]